METTIQTFEKKELGQVEQEFYRFLLGLDEERETLFPEEYSDEAYSKVCRWLVDATFFVVVAFHGDKMVGASGLRRTRRGFLGSYWPVVRGYSIVDKNFQGRGIGSRLFDEKNRVMNKLFAFHLSEVVRGNVSMERIFEKASYRVVHRDESYTYYYKTSRGFMDLFASIFEWVYRYLIKKRARAGFIVNPDPI